MLTFLFLSVPLCFSTLCSPSFPLLCSLVSLCYLSFSSIDLQQVSFNMFSDDMALYISTLSVFVVFVSSVSFNSSSNAGNFVLVILLYACLLVFQSTNCLTVFIFYEVSLLPILFIILKWGSYPERSLSAVILLTYTLIFTSPFLFVLFSIYGVHHSFSLGCLTLSPSLHADFMLVLTLLAFVVNLPVYGLHFWLPMAHVEAPTFGSIILAGVLLKLGGAGLVRFLPLFNLGLLYYSLVSYTIVFLVFSSIICCAQSDVKRLVAYSSVSHIIALLPLSILSTPSSNYAMALLMLFHGLSSPLLFFLVGLLYELFFTRQLSLLRGLIVVSPLLSLMFCAGFFFSLGAPPFPSFISEVFFITFSLSITPKFMIPLLLFTFFSLVYSLGWFSTLTFNSTPSSAVFQNLSLKSFIVVFLILLFSFFLLLNFLLNDCV